MLSIVLESNDPFFNLATEEYLLHSRKEDFIILSTNDPAVIIGKHQVAHREVNTRFVEENMIPVIRRISGGGTVYHDRGNLNFAFIRQSEPGKQVDFRLYLQPVINFLDSIGIEAIFEGKNDLTVKGLKISGNAEHVFRDRVLHHGTLLFNASIDNLRSSIRQKTENYSTRAVESNRSPVINLKDELRNIKDINSLITSMLNYFSVTMDNVAQFSLSNEDISAIKFLSETKYRTWEWNWGYGPPYTFTNIITMNGKPHHCRLVVKDGIIWECDIEGSSELVATGKRLIGCRHMYPDLLKTIRAENIIIPEEDVYNFF
jgi:lipoate-protein ligase A